MPHGLWTPNAPALSACQAGAGNWCSSRARQCRPSIVEDADPAEPSLGSVGEANHSQERWAAGSRCDLEQDDSESGIADQDGLDEQVPFRDWQGVGMV
jgi:hypothetical protein